MKLKFFKTEDLDRNVKATVHKTGKIGFTTEAANKLKLSPGMSADIAINEDDFTDSNLYVRIWVDDTAGVFRISKAGQYYYMNTKLLLDKLKVDYENDTIVYDIVQEMIEGIPIYVFKRRYTKKDLDTLF